MKHEHCQYCQQQFANESGYERHLKTDMSCMTPDEMRNAGFVRKPRGWAHDDHAAAQGWKA